MQKFYIQFIKHINWNCRCWFESYLLHLHLRWLCWSSLLIPVEKYMRNSFTDLLFLTSFFLFTMVVIQIMHSPEADHVTARHKTNNHKAWLLLPWNQMSSSPIHFGKKHSKRYISCCPVMNSTGTERVIQLWKWADLVFLNPFYLFYFFGQRMMK